MPVAADPPTITYSLEEWWLRERAKFTAKMRKNFDALIILGCWSLWKNRNVRVFNNLRLEHLQPFEAPRPKSGAI
jgi:hypothetical protein